jgi:hypothetical protein
MRADGPSVALVAVTGLVLAALPPLPAHAWTHEPRTLEMGDSISIDPGRFIVG